MEGQTSLHRKDDSFFTVYPSLIRILVHYPLIIKKCNFGKAAAGIVSQYDVKGESD